MDALSAAVVVFLFRYFGVFEIGFASALIVMNVFSPIFDEICESVLHVYRHRDAVEGSLKTDIKNFIAKKKAEKKSSAEISEVLIAEEVSEETQEIDLSEASEENEKEEAVR